MLGNRIPVHIAAESWIALAAALLLIPIPWLIAWLLAVLTHELSHYGCILLCGGAVSAVQIDAWGVSMEILPMEPIRECFCALAGPCGSLLLLLLRTWFPGLALCGLLQAAFNLLPVFPLDGGRALRCLIQLWLPHRLHHAVYAWMQRIVLGLLIVVATYLQTGFQLGMLPILVVGILLMKNIRIKNLANRNRNRYNSLTNQ